MILQGIDTEQLRTTMASFDWKEAFHDPLYANSEADTFQDKLDAARMTKLVEDLQRLFFSSGDGRRLVGELINAHWIDQPMIEQVPMLFALNDGGHQGHALLDDALQKAKVSLASGKHFVAYNERSYFLTEFDVHFFATKEAALQYAALPADRFTSYQVVGAGSMNALRKVLRVEETTIGRSVSTLLSTGARASRSRNRKKIWKH